MAQSLGIFANGPENPSLLLFVPCSSSPTDVIIMGLTEVSYEVTELQQKWIIMQFSRATALLSTKFDPVSLVQEQGAS